MRNVAIDHFYNVGFSENTQFGYHSNGYHGNVSRYTQACTKCAVSMKGRSAGSCVVQQIARVVTHFVSFIHSGGVVGWGIIPKLGPTHWEFHCEEVLHVSRKRCELQNFGSGCQQHSLPHPRNEPAERERERERNTSHYVQFDAAAIRFLGAQLKFVHLGRTRTLNLREQVGNPV